MRTFLVVLALAVSLAGASATPVHAAKDAPKRPIPTRPPGCEISDTISERGSTECAQVTTGPINQFKRYAD